MSSGTAPPMTTPRVAAGVLFFDADGRVLLVKPTYKDGWEIPGGYVEPDETPLAACHRELQEELGLKVEIRGLLVTDWAPSPAEGDKLLFVFDGGSLTPTQLKRIKLPADELEAWEFKSRDQLAEALPPRLQRRISRAIDARHTSTHLYLENGELPTEMRPEEVDWWTTDHVAAYLNVSTSTVRAYLTRDQMPSPDLRAGQQRLWRPETIQRWHSQRPRKASAE